MAGTATAAAKQLLFVSEQQAGTLISPLMERSFRISHIIFQLQLKATLKANGVTNVTGDEQQATHFIQYYDRAATGITAFKSNVRTPSHSINPLSIEVREMLRALL